MTSIANSAKRENFRFQTRYEIQGLAENSKIEKLTEGDMAALDRAIQEMKDFHARAADAIMFGRLI